MKKFTEIYKGIVERSAHLEFMPTGFQKLDADLDGGFMRKELVVVGGPTGIGKSYFSGQLMWNIARQGFKCAYFSLEISAEMLVSRLMGALANVKSTTIINGLAQELSGNAVIQAHDKMSAYENLMFFYDNIYDLKEITNQMHEHKFDFVVIDFIQNIVSNRTDEYDRLTHASLTLQKTAKDTNSCVLLLSQLSNAMARDGASGKFILEFKGSGAIAMVADLAFYIYRDYELAPELLYLKFRKNRRGISGFDYQLRFEAPGGHLTQL